MNTPFPASYFDGRTPRSQPVMVTLLPTDEWQIESPTVQLRHAFSAVKVSDRLARVPRHFHLPDGAFLETEANDEVDALLSRRGSSRLHLLLHRLESHARLAAAATLIIVAAVTVTLYLGIPYGARRIALMVPTELDQTLGQTSLRALSGPGTNSLLSPADKYRVRRQCLRLITSKNEPMPRLEFRRIGDMANAFALPGNLIVLTDDLVRMATTDDELAAVLAHEIGHLRQRHALQSLLRQSSALLLVATVTGDLSTLTSTAALLPFLLLQKGYSRDFEREADAFALERLRAAGIPTTAFATILKKLSAQNGAVKQPFNYLNTHPETEDRIQPFVTPAEPLESNPLTPIEKAGR